MRAPVTVQLIHEAQALGFPSNLTHIRPPTQNRKKKRACSFPDLRRQFHQNTPKDTSWSLTPRTSGTHESGEIWLNYSINVVKQTHTEKKEIYSNLSHSLNTNELFCEIKEAENTFSRLSTRLNVTFKRWEIKVRTSLLSICVSCLNSKFRSSWQKSKRKGLRGTWDGRTPEVAGGTSNTSKVSTGKDSRERRVDIRLEPGRHRRNTRRRRRNKSGF